MNHTQNFVCLYVKQSEFLLESQEKVILNF